MSTIHVQETGSMEFDSTDPIYARPTQRWTRAHHRILDALNYVQDEVDRDEKKSEVIGMLWAAAERADRNSDHFLYVPYRDVSDDILSKDREYIKRAFITSGSEYLGKASRYLVQFNVSLDIDPGEVEDLLPGGTPQPVEVLSAVVQVMLVDGNQRAEVVRLDWSTQVSHVGDTIGGAYLEFRDWYNGVRDAFRTVYGNAPY